MSQVDIVHVKIVFKKCSDKISESEDLQTEQDVPWPK